MLFARMLVCSLALATGALVGACLLDCEKPQSFYLEDGTYTVEELYGLNWMSVTIDGDIAEIEYGRSDGHVFRVTYSELQDGPSVSPHGVPTASPRAR